MGLPEAAAILKQMYENAEPGEQVVQIHLFGIRYAKELKNMPLKSIAESAGISSSYGTEIAKGRKLAKFVRPI